MKKLLCALFAILFSIQVYAQLQYPMSDIRDTHHVFVDNVGRLVDSTTYGCIYIFDGDSLGVCTTVYIELPGYSKHELKMIWDRNFKYVGNNKWETSEFKNNKDTTVIRISVEMVDIPGYKNIFSKRSIIKAKGDD